MDATAGDRAAGFRFGGRSLMRLYHFCPEWMLEDILRQGLTLGSLVAQGPNAEIMLVPGYQWLTKNREWNQSWCEFSSRPYKRNEIRLAIKIPFMRCKQAIPWLRFCAKNPNPSWRNLNAYGDPDNWYVYHGNIPPNWIEKVYYNPALLVTKSADVEL